MKMYTVYSKTMAMFLEGIGHKLLRKYYSDIEGKEVYVFERTPEFLRDCQKYTKEYEEWKMLAKEGKA